MASNTNSFRLQRLTKTVGIKDRSVSEYQPRETFKLAALNSIGRGVKYNDISFMTGRDLNKLRKEPQAGEDIQYQSAHSNLSQTRKNYDSMHKEKTKRDESISKLKEQKNKLTIIQGELLENKQQGMKKVTDLQSKLQNIKLMFTEADMQKKVLEQMRNRLKKDKVVYDQRKFNQEKELRFLRKQKEVIGIDKTDLVENDDRTNKVCKKYLQQLKAEQNQREEHLASLQFMIEEKTRLNHINLQRSVEMTQIAERAMQDKDEEQVRWQKLYLANKLVAKLLRDKMDKEMTKFFIVESAFKTIKISTGVSDAESLVSKFLNKQSAYGDLLGKIAENEKRIEELKHERERLAGEAKQLQNQKQIIDSTKRVEITIDSEVKELEGMGEKQKKVILLRNNLRSWVHRNAKKIQAVTGKKVNISSERDLKAVGQAFIEYLKTIDSELTEIEKTEQKTANEKFSENERIKPNNKLIRIQNESKEESDAEEVVDEFNLIGDQRSEIHQVNEKFMKEVRAKYEEKRKAQAEAASPKKKPEPQKPKAPVNE